MSVIKEDYVSFETSKLLKEKGFDQNCATYYLDEQVWRHYHGEVIPKDKQIYAAPTQAIAMKWLREVHNIYITINYSAFLYGTHPYYWDIDKMDISSRDNTQIEASTNTHDYSFAHYETACESAIKYCLENLI